MDERLTISCFGGLSVECAGRPTLNFGTEKAKALLVYLAVESGRPHSRESLAGLLWSDQVDESAMHSLRQALFSLRKALQDDINPTPILLISRDAVQLNPGSSTRLDTVEFSREMQLALRNFTGRDVTGHVDIRALKRAVALYRGHFLDQFSLGGSPLFDEWAVLERESYSRQAIQALGILMVHHERRGEYSLARQAAERLIELFPWEEHAHASLMRLLAVNGLWSAALAQYANCRRMMDAEFGLAPSAETDALYAQVRIAAAKNLPLQPRFEPASHNIPRHDTQFVGRTVELDQLSAWLADPGCRLISVIGMGGMGKTSLALEAGREQVGSFKDGVYFLPLSGVNTLVELISTISGAIGFRFFGEGSATTQLTGYLRSKNMLLILDGFEHLLPPAGEPDELINFILGLLESASAVKVLVTSRSPLNLRKETILYLPGLSLPDVGLGAEMTNSDAATLFIQAARRIVPPFSLDENGAAVADICAELAGVPLAIELAASWVRVHSCAQILAEIRRDTDYLSSTMSDIPAAHRSMRAVFTHSWELLSHVEQDAFRRLAVFQGSFDLPTAELVTASPRSVLTGLIQKSLFHPADTSRYSLHNLVRQFASEKLASEPQCRDETQERFIRFYVEMLESLREQLKNNQQLQALQDLDRERENWRSAWDWMIAGRRLADIARSSETIFHYFNIRAEFEEGIAKFSTAAGQLELVIPQEPLYGRVLTCLGALAYRAREGDLAYEALRKAAGILEHCEDIFGLALCLIYWSGILDRKKDHAGAQEAVERSFALFRQLEDDWGQSHALYLKGLYLNRKGIIDEANTVLTASLAAARKSGDLHRQISPLNVLGDGACQAGDYDQAEQYFTDSLEICRAIGDRYNQALVELNLGTVHHIRKDYEKARTWYEASLAACIDIGDGAGQAMALANIGELLSDIGKHQEALAYFLRGLELSRQQEDPWSEMSCLNNLANTSIELGDIASAEKYVGAALALVKDLDAAPVAAIALLNLARVRFCQDDQPQAAELLAVILHEKGVEEYIHTKAVNLAGSLTVPLPTSPEATLAEWLSQLSG